MISWNVPVMRITVSEHSFLRPCRYIAGISSLLHVSLLRWKRWKKGAQKLSTIFYFIYYLDGLIAVFFNFDIQCIKLRDLGNLVKLIKSVLKSISSLVNYKNESLLPIKINDFRMLNIKCLLHFIPTRKSCSIFS